jgi:hypothetical protein
MSNPIEQSLVRRTSVLKDCRLVLFGGEGWGSPLDWLLTGGGGLGSLLVGE